jgi:type-F conjugative transfer system pilin assembly protein TrbC
MMLILATTEIKRDVEELSRQWANIADKPISKEVQAFIDDLQMNTDCCHRATKTFTRNPLTGEDYNQETHTGSGLPGYSSSNDAHKDQVHAQAKHNMITVFMSYSVPKTVWQSLWQEAKTIKQPIQFVLRGLPNNSFQELAKKIMEYGCPVAIDPPLFEHHHITAVPAFLVEEKGIVMKNSRDKQDHNARHDQGHQSEQERIFYGNVSLSCVMENHMKHTTPEVTPKAIQQETKS